MKVGIFGGTFDPIHYGHLRIAQIALKKFKLDKMLFIPSGNPPHKSKHTIQPSNHRYEMVKLAISDNDNFYISNIEIEKKTTTYTIETIKEISKIAYKDSEFYFLIGSDAFLQMDSWNNLGELLSICNLMVFTRYEEQVKEIKEKAKKYEKLYDAVILPIEEHTLNISSTKIRNMIQSGKPFKYLVPDDVENYIKYNKLYI